MDTQSSILDNLNIEQEKAARKIDGPVLILAGAGSGKTRTVTFRIAHMILEKGINPYSILAVTFTNKAAKEMVERVEKLIGEDSRKTTISTFHSFGLRLLRIYGDRLGYEKNFNIYDVDDQKRLVKELLKSIGVGDNGVTPREVVSIISKLKEELISPKDYKEDSRGFLSNYKIVSEVYERYERNLRKNNAMDFADILVNTNKLLDIPEIKEKIQERYKYIMIDEYQDTNQIQYEIVGKIAEKYKNLCVVGDEDQSIYGFRGANIQNILNFEKDYEDAYVIKLEQNYRSTKNILSVANSVIKNNETSRGKKLWTDRIEGRKAAVIKAPNGREEAYLILQEINNLVNSKYQYRDISILYRTNAQSRLFEELFINLNIPYKVFGGMQFYQRREIKDILAYMTIINNTADTLSLKRILNVPKRKIGTKTIEKLEGFAAEEEVSLFEILGKIENYSISSTLKVTIAEFHRKIMDIREKLEYTSVSEIFDEIVETFKYNSYLESFKEEVESRKANLGELKNAIVEQEKTKDNLRLGEYLENIILISATDNMEVDDNYIKLMTIHNSKGLEFPVVFIPGFEDETFPSSKADFDPKQLEEERRLCYVAITRAEKVLYFCHADQRFVYGSILPRTESRFLSEVPEELLEYRTKKDDSKRVPKILRKADSVAGNKSNGTSSRGGNGNLSNFSVKDLSKKSIDGSNDSLPYQINDRVIHKKFGNGVVRKIDMKVVEVEFRSGKKKFLTSKIALFMTKL